MPCEIEDRRLFEVLAESSVLDLALSRSVRPSSLSSLERRDQNPMVQGYRSSRRVEGGVVSEWYSKSIARCDATRGVGRSLSRRRG